MARITISLPEKMIDETKRLASATGRTFSGLIRISLEETLKQEKDREKEVVNM